MRDMRSIVRERMSLRTIVIAIVVSAAGMSLLGWTASSERWQDATSWQAFLQNLGALLFVTGLLTVVWDLFSKRAFAKELLDLTGLADDVRAAGLVRAVSSFRTEMNWPNLLRKTSTLDLFVCWARTWRNQHESELAAILTRKSGLIRVILPDHEHAETLATMVTHFSGYDADRIKQEVADAVAFFKKLHTERKNRSARVEIRHVRRVPLFSWYRLDEQVAILAFYAHRQKVSTIPTFVCRRGGFIYEFADHEFEYLLSDEAGSRLVLMEESLQDEHALR